MRSDLCEAEISDHKKLNVPVLRKTFVKDKLKAVFYRCCRMIDQNSFK